MDQRLLVLLIVLHSFVDVWSVPHLATLLNKKQKFCGDNLTKTMELVCHGKYNSPTSKKSLNDWLSYGEYEDYLPSDNEEDNRLDFPFLTKEVANSYAPRYWRSKKQGITAECCDRPCTYRHLYSYCA